MVDQLTWGTPYRLDNNGTTFTTAGGTWHKNAPLVSITVADTTFALAGGQQVLTADGIKHARHLKAGTDRLAMIRDCPLTFGDAHYPFTMFLIGVMAATYDNRYRMISSEGFTDDEREEILAAMPEAMKELSLEQKWPLYPNFVRVSATDGSHRWVLTSAMFDHLTRACTELGLTVNLMPTVINPVGLSKATIIAWMRGFATAFSADEPEHYYDAQLQMNTLLRRLNIDSMTDDVMKTQLSELEVSELPFYVSDNHYYAVQDVINLNSMNMSLFCFENEWWIYPPYSAPTSGGIVCKRGES